MSPAKKARAIGFNHVALEVGDIDAALAFYGRLFDFELRGRSKTSAFIDLGDQFLALQKGRGFARSEEHTSELQSHSDLVCRLLLEKKKICEMNNAVHGFRRNARRADVIER